MNKPAVNHSRRNARQDRVFQALGLGTTLLALGLLAIFLLGILQDGLGRLSPAFFTSLPSRFPAKAGIYTALLGTLWILVLTAVVAIPVGVGAGIYLEEYARKSRWAYGLEINISNLAGVPSIIYGLMGLDIFVRLLHWGESVLTAAVTLALLILPVIIVATREALRAVPSSYRDASYGLGATQWQTTRYQVLPAAAGGIMTGIILALARAVGETAPLIVIGVLAYVPFAPTSPRDEYSALPVQIFNWISRPQAGFATNAAAAILVLLAITFLLNGTAILLRNRWQKEVR